MLFKDLRINRTYTNRRVSTFIINLLPILKNGSSDFYTIYSMGVLGDEKYLYTNNVQ